MTDNTIPTPGTPDWAGKPIWVDLASGDPERSRAFYAGLFGWLVVSGRDGLVNADIIRAQRDYLEQVLNKIEKLAQKKRSPDAVEALITPLLSSFKIPANRHQKYTQRLRYGLYHYYAHHYHPASNLAGEE